MMSVYLNKTGPMGKGQALRQRGSVTDGYCHENAVSRTTPKLSRRQRQAFPFLLTDLGASWGSVWLHTSLSLFGPTGEGYVVTTTAAQDGESDRTSTCHVPWCLVCSYPTVQGQLPGPRPRAEGGGALLTARPHHGGGCLTLF